MAQNGEIIEFPGTFSAGVDFSAKCVLPGYAAPVWAVSAVIRGPESIDLAATGNGSEHTFSAPAATTTGWAPGAYWVSIRATDGVKVVEVTRLQMTIEPDLAAVSGAYDGRSQNEIALDAINAVLAKRATIDQQRYTINNRELWRTPMADLLKLRAFYTTQVRRERRRAAGVTGFGRPVMVRFSNQ